MTNECSHGQLRRQCELCERDDALAVAFSVLEGKTAEIKAQAATIAELRERMARTEGRHCRQCSFVDCEGADNIPHLDSCASNAWTFIDGLEKSRRCGCDCREALGAKAASKDIQSLCDAELGYARTPGGEG